MAAPKSWYPGSTTSTAIAVTASDVAVGDLMVFQVRDSLGTGTPTGTLTDNRGTTWLLAWSVPSDGSGTVACYYAVAGTTASHTVSYAVSTSRLLSCDLHLFTGTWGADPLDTGKISTATGTKPLSTGAVTPSVPTAVLVACAANGNGINSATVGSPWTAQALVNNRHLAAYRLVTEALPYEATFNWSPSTSAGAGIAAFVEDSDDPALSIDEQPTATQSGYLIDPAPVVHVLDAEGALDTSFTGNVTASLLGSGGVLLGTLTVAAVAGVATFDDLRPCEAGSYQLRFSASGYADLDSAAFAVTAGEGSTVIVRQEAPMRPIRRNEPTAALRDIPITILADDGSPWDGDPDAGGGVKAMLSQNFGEETESPANIVKIAEGDFRVRPTDAYTDIAEGSIIKARVPAAAGRRQAFGYAHIIPADTYVSAEVARKAIVDAVVIASDGGNGYNIAKMPESNQIARTIPGVGVVTITATFSPTVPGIVSAGGS